VAEAAEEEEVTAEVELIINMKIATIMNESN